MKHLLGRLTACLIPLTHSTDWWSITSWQCHVLIQENSLHDAPKMFVIAQFSHSVFDGCSCGIFVRDLVLSLNGVELGGSQPMPPSHAERVKGELLTSVCRA